MAAKEPTQTGPKPPGLGVSTVGVSGVSGAEAAGCGAMEVGALCGGEPQPGCHEYVGA